LVERNLAKVEVASSNLVSRSISFVIAPSLAFFLIRAERAQRCEESQWRQKAADETRFSYQRAVVGG
jgi:hypothetical protein